MIYLLTSTLIIIGLVLLGLSWQSPARRAPALRSHVFKEEIVGTAFILAGVWTLAVYGLMQVI